MTILNQNFFNEFDSFLNERGFDTKIGDRVLLRQKLKEHGWFKTSSTIHCVLN